MQTAFLWQRVTDGDRWGLVVDIIPGDRRGLGGGCAAELRVQWDDGEFSFECQDDLFAEVEPRDARP